MTRLEGRLWGLAIGVAIAMVARPLLNEWTPSIVAWCRRRGWDV
jgi:hypothetical protein